MVIRQWLLQVSNIASENLKQVYPLWLSSNEPKEFPGGCRFHPCPRWEGLRIQRCSELWCRSKMRLRSGVAVPAVFAGSFISNATLSLGTSICCIYDPKKQKKQKENLKHSLGMPHINSGDDGREGDQTCSSPSPHLLPFNHNTLVLHVGLPSKI